jgi:hypothetical protein
VNTNINFVFSAWVLFKDSALGYVVQMDSVNEATGETTLPLQKRI